jgi:hypothetical protein
MSAAAVIFLFVLLSSGWVYADAPQNGITRAWAFGAFLLWPVFFPLYLLVRMTARQRQA